MARTVSSLLFGREDAMSRLGEAASRAIDGIPTAVVVAGEAGIGKTRLVRDFVQEQRASGAVALYGHCVEVVGADLPFAAVAGVLRDLVRQQGVARLRELAGHGWPALSVLLPELTADADEAVTSTEARSQLFDVTAGVIEQLGRHHPVVVVIEDLHWSDRSTRDLLSYLIRVIPATRLTLVLTVRTEDQGVEVTGLLMELARLPSTESVTLRRLDGVDVARQAADIVNRPLSRFELARLLELSEGVPFWVEELLAVGGGSAGRLPDSARGGSLARVVGLSAQCRRLLEAASLADIALTHRLLGQVVGDQIGDLDEALDEAIGAAVLVTDPVRQGYRFRHALLRATIAEAVLPGRGIRWHAAWATAIEADPGALDPVSAPVAAAYHWEQAGDIDRAFDAAVVATARCAATESFSEQAKLLRRLLAWWDSVEDPESRSGRSRDQLVDDTFEALAITENWPGVIGTMDAELGTRDYDQRPVRRSLLLLRRLSAEHSQSGRWDNPARVRDDVSPLARLEEAESCLQDAPVTRDLVLALIQATWIDTNGSRARELASRAIEAAHELGDAQLELAAKSVHAMSWMWELQCARAAEEIQAIMPHRDRLPVSHAAAVPIVLIRAYMALGRYSDAAETARAALVPVEDPRAAANWALYAWGRVGALCMLGRWAEAQNMLDAARSLNLTDDALCLHDWAGLIAQWRGDGDLARLLMGDFRNAVTGPSQDIDYQDLVALCWLGAEIAAAGGDVAAMRSALAPIWTGDSAEPQQLEPGVWKQNFAEIDFAESGLLLLVAARAEADAAVQARSFSHRTAQADAAQIGLLRDATTRVPFQGPLGAALHAHVIAELDRADGRVDTQRWQDVVDQWTRLPHPHELGWALLRLAEAHASQGSPAQAQPPLASALAIADELGARPLAARVRRLAGRAHIDLKPSSGSGPTVSNGARVLPLTEREFEVLTLLATGLSNAEIGRQLFISPKTASVHVSHILAKLGASTRTQAAAFAHQAALDRHGDAGR